MLSRVCEEFGCLPGVADEALQNDPHHYEMILTVMKLRAFARTKHQYDNAKKIADVPTGRMADLIQEIEFDHVEGLMKKDGNG